jgi:flagellar biosynthesis chaperone FliJ
MHQIDFQLSDSIHSLSLEKAIKIQEQQVEAWSKILNNDAIIILKLKCCIENTVLEKNKCIDGFKVFRGHEMNNFIQNLAVALQNDIGTEMDKFLQILKIDFKK